jgi:hypothetical protein
MIRFLSLLFVTLFATTAFGLPVFNSSGRVGDFDSILCSTGLTCTASKNKISISSSPSLTSALTISGAEATDAIFTMAADESDDSGDDWQLRSVASGNAFTISNDASGSHVAKLTISATAGNVSGPGTGTMVGFKQNQVAASATTLTAAQCGSTIINAGVIEVELPEASTVLGCRYTFIVGNASTFTIDPDAADQIMLLTNAAGDAIAADAVGESVVIEAISASAWAPVGAEKGTWTDAN